MFFFKLFRKLNFLFSLDKFIKIEGNKLFYKSLKPVAKGWYILFFKYKNFDSRVFCSFRSGVYGFSQSRYFLPQKLKSRLIHLRKKDYLYFYIDKKLNDNFLIDDCFLIKIPYLLAFYIVNNRVKNIFPNVNLGKFLFSNKWKIYNYFHFSNRRKTSLISYKKWILFFEKPFLKNLKTSKILKNEFIIIKSNNLKVETKGDWIFAVQENGKLVNRAFEIVDFFLKQTNQECNLIYSDEDFINDSNQRYDPNFKCAWNRELFFSSIRYSDFWIIKKDLWNMAINSLIKEGEKLTIFKIILNITYFLESKNKIFSIKHLPLIIFHKRKKIINEVDTKYLLKFIKERYEFFGKLKNILISKANNTNILVWQCAKTDLLSIMIPFRDKVDLLRNCLNSIKEYDPGCNFELLLIDNKSVKEETKLFLEKFKQISYFGEKRNIISMPTTDFNYSLLNNKSSENINGNALLLLNNDIEFLSLKWGYYLLSNALRPGIGCVGAKLLYQDNSVQHGGVILGIGSVAGHAHKFRKSEDNGFQERLNTTQELSAVTGACLAISKKNWLALKGLNEKDLKINYNDVDLCLRSKLLGLRNLYLPHVLAYHLESKTRGAPAGKTLNQWHKEKNYMIRNWHKFLFNDPAYSPHLSLKNENFEISINQSIKIELRNVNLKSK